VDILLCKVFVILGFVIFQPSTETEMYELKGPSGFLGELWQLLEKEMNFT
jgi:hypothetical protein